MAEKTVKAPAKTTAAKATKQPAATQAPKQALAAKRAELLAAQKGLYDGTLQNPHAIKALKKEIARLLTKINQEKGAK